MRVCACPMHCSRAPCTRCVCCFLCSESEPTHLNTLHSVILSSLAVNQRRKQAQYICKCVHQRRRPLSREYFKNVSNACSVTVSWLQPAAEGPQRRALVRGRVFECVWVRLCLCTRLCLCLVSLSAAWNKQPIAQVERAHRVCLLSLQHVVEL